MKNYPKISVVTPSFNQAAFIERTIKSILRQNYPDLEYIIMDGGSTDGTVEILKKYEDKIIWKSEKDRGQAHAINKGLALATGDILAYLNSDDAYEDKTLLKIAEFFQRHPETKWIYGKCRIVDESSREIRHWITAYKNFFLTRYNYGALLVLNFLSQPAVFWRRQILDECGFFDEREYYVMDYEYWLRIGQKYKPGVINDYLASYRIHPSAKSTSSFGKHYSQEIEVAKRYTQNPVLILLHHLNFFSILFTYNLLKVLRGS
ncbi:MAG: glycosyltransferase [Chloroflexi bacterium]|nr:glycosyltransferase [Chloroflexota bacterium]MCL5075306.1 glycosyltransferase [Chloroflexota bacterium]